MTHESDRELFSCTFDGCKNIYLTKSGLSRHFKQSHVESKVGPDIIIYDCDICEKVH